MGDIKHNQDAYDDESDFDEEYFTRTYQPLSNLPTPPPSCRDSIVSLSPEGLIEQDELLESALLGPAVHLVNLVPPTASLATPSVSTVHEILTRANLPPETIALAVCILDSLNSKFSHNWRLSCPLARLEGASAPAQHARLHIDAVCPEVIVLASLIVAVKFLEDYQEPMHYYAAHWGNDLWTCEQINVTERCIMENLGYRIMPLWDRKLIEDALADMERASSQANLDRLRLSSVISTKQPTSSRKTLAASTMHPRPAEVPRFATVAWGGSSDSSGAGIGEWASQTTFTGGPAPGLGLDPLQLPLGRKSSSSMCLFASAYPPAGVR